MSYLLPEVLAHATKQSASVPHLLEQLYALGAQDSIALAQVLYWLEHYVFKQSYRGSATYWDKVMAINDTINKVLIRNI